MAISPESWLIAVSPSNPMTCCSVKPCPILALVIKEAIKFLTDLFIVMELSLPCQSSCEKVKGGRLRV